MRWSRETTSVSLFSPQIAKATTRRGNLDGACHSLISPQMLRGTTRMEREWHARKQTRRWSGQRRIIRLH